MIFVILGSQKFQFNRLLKKIDMLIDTGVIKEDVFAQIGYSDYIPRNYEYKVFLNHDQFNSYISQADIVITHGGTGSIINALKRNKKVIAVPRLAKYKEHVDDHQKQIIEQFSLLNYIVPCFDDDLEEKIKTISKIRLNKYVSNTQVIIDDIKQYLKEIM